MSIRRSQKTFASLLLVGGLALSSHGYASTLTIDNFTHAQSVTAWGDSAEATSKTVEGLTGTDLTHASRTFTALATGGGAHYENIVSGYNVDSGKYLLQISNSPRSVGTASVGWNFDAIDFTRHGNAILLDVDFIDHGVNVEMVANGDAGTASSGVKSISGTGNYLINFDDFINSGVFGNVHSFSLNFTGPKAWDGDFKILTTFTTPSFAAPVPVPSAFVLMGSALVGFMSLVRRKNQAI